MADGVDGEQVETLKTRLSEQGAQGMVIAPSMAPVSASGGQNVTPDAMLNGLPSVTMDAVIVPGGESSVQTLKASGQGCYYLQEAYKHLKPIAALGEGEVLLDAAGVAAGEDGVFLGDTVESIFEPFAKVLGEHRVWSRDGKANDMPA
ncbi:DJ-1/PfpI family protein [Pistricoccus aurantiacus]|uniref:DJ-1/PfpI family protein n=1 Tax=Pistricoccus aurantiacus TaxID=1883414 RepID=UPI001FE7D613|nr:DJ-1/PfpI family protein [Pistricoccus aurantiacus]